MYVLQILLNSIISEETQQMLLLFKREPKNVMKGCTNESKTDFSMREDRKLVQPTKQDRLQVY